MHNFNAVCFFFFSFNLTDDLISRGESKVLYLSFALNQIVKNKWCKIIGSVPKSLEFLEDINDIC